MIGFLYWIANNKQPTTNESHFYWKTIKMVIYGVAIIFDYFTVTYFQLNQIVSDPRMMTYASSAKREI